MDVNIKEVPTFIKPSNSECLAQGVRDVSYPTVRYGHVTSYDGDAFVKSSDGSFWFARGEGPEGDAQFISKGGEITKFPVGGLDTDVTKMVDYLIDHTAGNLEAHDNTFGLMLDNYLFLRVGTDKKSLINRPLLNSIIKTMLDDKLDFERAKSKVYNSEGLYNKELHDIWGLATPEAFYETRDTVFTQGALEEKMGWEK